MPNEYFMLWKQEWANIYQAKGGKKKILPAFSQKMTQTKIVDKK